MAVVMASTMRCVLPGGKTTGAARARATAPALRGGDAMTFKLARLLAMVMLRVFPGRGEATKGKWSVDVYAELYTL
jgi:hypothetical protein